MIVTRVKTDNLTPQDKGICGEFTVYLDDILCIHKVFVINGEKGLFISFPNTGKMSRYANSKRFHDIVHPTKTSLRLHIQDKVLEHYNDEVSKL